MERRRSSYFRSNTKEIEESNIQQQNNNLLLQKNLSEDLGEEGSKENRYEESENSREDDLPIREGLFNETASIIKGILLAFVFFSVIIYSLLYMLTPDKSANLIFIGKYNSSLFNNSLCTEENLKNNFYILDELKTREKIIILNISLNCLNENETNN